MEFNLTPTHRRREPFSIILLAASLLAPSMTSASGSFRGGRRGPSKIQGAHYTLGKALFNGTVPPGPGLLGSEASLKVMHAQLPDDARARSILPALAGKLSAEQLAALELFLAVRYRVSK